ncbi:hypothetical protein TNCV_721101 [Trichonephila clavipes]|nr:hypothetical protein TNCV_721101 [Trichonephila clavipes]
MGKDADDKFNVVSVTSPQRSTYRTTSSSSSITSDSISTPLTDSIVRFNPRRLDSFIYSDSDSISAHPAYRIVRFNPRRLDSTDYSHNSDRLVQPRSSFPSTLQGLGSSSFKRYFFFTDHLQLPFGSPFTRTLAGSVIATFCV